MNETQRRLREDDRLTVTLLAMAGDQSRPAAERHIARTAFERIERLEMTLTNLMWNNIKHCL